MDRFHQLMTELRGGITPKEAVLLRRLASECQDGCIVEVGSFRGKSAVALAWGVRDVLPASARPQIYCIEPHRPFTGFYGGDFGPADRGAFYATMVATEAFQEVALVNLSSEEVTPSWTRKIGLLFIDGDHRYDGVKRDFDCWDAHLSQGGILAFDDATDRECGPYRLIEEILATGRYDLADKAGKIVVLRKLRADAPRPAAQSRRRILIACDRVVAAGGIFRFDRTGRVLQEWGHEVAFLSLSGDLTPDFRTSLPVLSFEEASAQSWDCVMVPGAGFTDAIIRRFRDLREPRFGVRIQHILNDQTRRASFKEVNASLAPDVVIFNNPSWPTGSYTEFAADRFHVLLGAVDTGRFRPAAYRKHPLSDSRWVVGGLVNKNADALVEALRLLPEDVSIRLYGHDTTGVAERYAALISAGKLALDGPLDGDELPAFYREVDCVASTERFAGWANLAAEAMASGVPLICTRHGTSAFAEHLQTALVIDEPTPSALAQEILRLKADAGLCAALAEKGRRLIEGFTWDRYARDMLALCAHDGNQHYLSCPELGLFGKWPLEERLQGLDSLVAGAAGCSVIDFGAAEGFVGREFLMAGASVLHGFELDPSRVAAARRLCSAWKDAQFRVADLSNWDDFRSENQDLLRPQYDIVLYLGLHHHLPQASRMGVLLQAAALASKYLAVRMPDRFFADDGVEAALTAAGLIRHDGDDGSTDHHLGSLRIYSRGGLRQERGR